MRKIKIFYLVIVVALLLAACSNNKKKTTGDMPGMNMPKTEITEMPDSAALKNVPTLDAVLQPTDEFIVASVPVTTLQPENQQIEANALGTIGYDNRQIGTISSRIAGRIEKLYVRYRYQYVNKGQKVMDIYSPELLTSQENLIFILRSDPNNQSLISAARQRLLLLGMSGDQVAQISRSGKPFYSVSVFSNYAGFVTELGFNNSMNSGSSNEIPGSNTDAMQTTSLTTSELPVKEGMYLEKGQQIFTIVNASRAVAYLNVFSDQQNIIKKGTSVVITPETAPQNKIRGTIDYIEPFYQPRSKTLSARVYFNNAALKLPIGTAVQAIIFTGGLSANWLPASAVITTGLNSVVFKKEGAGFRAHAVTTGIKTDDKVQIISGLSSTDSVAVNAQHLVGSESTIKIQR